MTTDPSKRTPSGSCPTRRRSTERTLRARVCYHYCAMRHDPETGTYTYKDGNVTLDEPITARTLPKVRESISAEDFPQPFTLLSLSRL